jgi:hypothetical protein
MNERNENERDVVSEVIEGVLMAVDQRYEQHMKAAVLPLAQRQEILSQGYAQLFSIIKRNRRDQNAMAAMTAMLADKETVGKMSGPDIAREAYIIADAMEAEASRGEQSTLEAIKNATLELRRAKEEAATAAPPSPKELAKRLSRKVSSKDPN